MQPIVDAELGENMEKSLLKVLMVFIVLALSVGVISAANVGTNIDPQVIYSDHSTTKLAQDTKSPVKLGLDPPNNSLNVPLNKTIRISFDEPIKFGNSWIELISRGGIVSPINKSIIGNTLIIKPKDLMANGIRYTLLIHTNSVKDFKDNSVAAYTSRFSTAVRIDVINVATGGDISKIYNLNNYIQKTVLSKQIFAKAKIGTPMITFGYGNGPNILIVAGVHGNELPAQAAAMKLINYLNGKLIRGKIHIIPFAIPSSTCSGHRYWNGQDPNRIANVPGSVTNGLVNLAKTLRFNAVGDFHSSIPGGVPGIDSALCTIVPTYGSYKIASYIAKYSGSTLIVDRVAGVKYPGALEDVTNLNGVPAVTCEVLAWHGTLNLNRLNKSFGQMFAFMRYFKIV
jgi:predicted deacylase